MFSLNKTRKRNMELWEKLSKENGLFHDRMEKIPDCSKDDSLIDAFLEALWKEECER